MKTLTPGQTLTILNEISLTLRSFLPLSISASVRTISVNWTNLNNFLPTNYSNRFKPSETNLCVAIVLHVAVVLSYCQASVDANLFEKRPLNSNLR